MRARILESDCSSNSDSPAAPCSTRETGTLSGNTSCLLGTVWKWTGLTQALDTLRPVWISNEPEKARAYFLETFDEDEMRLLENRSEERRVGKECRSRWSP